MPFSDKGAASYLDGILACE